MKSAKRQILEYKAKQTCKERGHVFEECNTELGNFIREEFFNNRPIGVYCGPETFLGHTHIGYFAGQNRVSYEYDLVDDESESYLTKEVTGEKYCYRCCKDVKVKTVDKQEMWNINTQ